MHGSEVHNRHDQRFIFRLSVLTARSSRKKNRTSGTQGNYRENAKKFYRELGKKSIEINEPPKIDEVESFWGNLWEKQKSYNKNATWLDQIETGNIEVNYQVWPQITLEEISN